MKTEMQNFSPWFHKQEEWFGMSLEIIVMVPKMFEPVKFCCISSKVDSNLISEWNEYYSGYKKNTTGRYPSAVPHSLSA